MVHHRVQRPRRGKVATERLLNDDTRALGATWLAELVNDGLKETRRDGEIVQRMLCVAQFPAQPLKGRRIAIVAVNVAQATAELGKSLRIEAPVILDAVPSALL